MNKVLTFFNENYLWTRDTLLFGQWTKFWDFIKLAHSSSEEASSKRLYGGAMILTCLVILFLFSASIFTATAWTYIAPYWTFVLLLGSGMISLGVVEKISSLVANFKVAQLQSLMPEPEKEQTKPVVETPKPEEPKVI